MTSGTDDDIPVEEAEDVKAVVTVSTEDEDDNELSMMSETAAAALTPTTDNENSDSSNNNNKCMIISQAEAMNPMRRTNMEDVCVIHKAGDWDCPDESMTYIGVYDGHGGRETVDFLEYGMHYHVAQELACNDDDTEVVSMQTRMERAFLMADIHAKLLGISSSGATVAVCLIKREGSEIHVTTANVGDSRIVLGQMPSDFSSPSSAEPPKVVRLTVDHCLDDPLEVARIEQAGGFIFKGRVCGVLAVTRSLGDQILKPYVTAHPAVREITVPIVAAAAAAGANNNKPHFLIVACDGLWDCMSDQDAVALVASHSKDDQSKKATVADFLVTEALRRGTADNVTAVVAWL